MSEENTLRLVLSEDRNLGEDRGSQGEQEVSGKDRTLSEDGNIVLGEDTE